MTAFLFSCREEELVLLISLEAGLIHVSEYGGNDGSIDLQISGGSPPFSFLWSNGSTEEDLDSLAAGTYSVIVCDQAEQTQLDTFIIDQPDPDSLKLSLVVHDVSRYGAGDGEILTTVTGGFPPYAYLWSDGSQLPVLTSLDGGTYFVTVTDQTGTGITDTAIVNEPGPDDIIMEANISDPAFTGAANGAIDLTISGGYPPYSLSWSTGATSEDICDLPAGDYAVTVTDSESQVVTREYSLSDSLVDIDGNAYSIMKIGDQYWMGENLRVKHSAEGYFVNSYVFNNQESNAAIYGRLYSWDAAMVGSTESGAQGACPCNWHIPTDDEFKELEIFLGMTPEEADLENTWRGAGVGTKLKSGGTSGYNALLSGRRTSSGDFSLLNQFEYMWSSDEYGSSYAWRRCLDINSTGVGRWNTFPKTYAFSVRCIKNE
ncbi:MAG: hypothetical protein JW801_16455 [Bacteroidales bacterium]|nr:hypothetical protein [Bacteroidales bacterium]